jgi:endonuclease V-like protein UPF0215 family
MKEEIRIIGIDDAPFDKFSEKEALVIGTIYRGGNYMDGLLSTKVKVDGSDATKKVAAMINKCKFKKQLRCIFLDGIAIAGFNVIDINELHKKTRIPVVVMMRKYPRIGEMEKALHKLKMDKKMELIKKAGGIHKADGLFIQTCGINVSKAEQMIKLTKTHSNIPEPLRIAHIIASGIKEGESRGRA